MKLTDLPAELIHHIFEFLPEKSAWPMFFANKKMHFFSCLRVEDKVKKIGENIEHFRAEYRNNDYIERHKDYIKKMCEAVIHSCHLQVAQSTYFTDSLPYVRNVIGLGLGASVYRLRLIRAEKNKFILNQTQTDSADSPPPQTSSLRCNP